MTVGMISRRYAKALFEYAHEKKVGKEVDEEMKTLANQFAIEPRLRAAMNNPIVTTKDKLNLLRSSMNNKCSPAFDRFIELVIKHKRESLLQWMALSYNDLYNQANNINQARLITATPVDKAAIDKLKTILQKIKPGTQVVTTEVDPKIEGGFVLFVDTYRLDASIASQLKRIKNQFIQENNRIG